MKHDRDHFLAADAEHLAGEAAQRDRFLIALVTNPVTRRALARDPVLLGHLERIDAASVFVTGPESAQNHARAVAQAALEAAAAIAGSLGAAEAGRASGVARKADVAERDTLIRKLWTGTDLKAGDSVRADRVQRQLYRQHRIEMSTRQILRVVGLRKKV